MFENKRFWNASATPHLPDIRRDIPPHELRRQYQVSYLALCIQISVYFNEREARKKVRAHAVNHRTCSLVVFGEAINRNKEKTKGSVLTSETEQSLRSCNDSDNDDHNNNDSYNDDGNDRPTSRF